MKKKIILSGGLLLSSLVTLAQDNDKTNAPDSLMETLTAILPYLCILLIIVLFIYVLLFVMKQNERHKRLKEWVKDIERTANSLAQSQHSHASSSDSSNAINNLKNQIADIRMELRALKPSPAAQHIERTAVPFHEPDTEPVAIVQIVTAQPPQQQEPQNAEEIFYLSTPNSEGSFNVRSAQPNYRPGASIYWFKKTAPDKAIFKIDEREASMQMALQYSDINIDPVCDPANAYHINTKRVRTPPGHEGVVELLDDKWIVTKKAKIYYE